MKKLNDYKITSGGYIFDMLDRGAHKFIRHMYPTVPYWLTASAIITYLRQLEKNRPTYIRYTLKPDPRLGKIGVIATMMEPGIEKPVAIAHFVFSAKNQLAKEKK